MTEIRFDFVPAGTVANAELGKIYVDVGNDFRPGILDHHHGDAPDACATQLALNHPDLIRSQIIDEKTPVTIIPHLIPDLDAIGAAWFAKRHLENHILNESDRLIADYICNIDRGFTTLHPSNPLSAYAVMMMRLNAIYSRKDQQETKSLQALESGFELLDTFKNHLKPGISLDDPDWLSTLPGIDTELESVKKDLQLYHEDIKRAEKFSCSLPMKDANGKQTVPGLCISSPSSALFKSWARGDDKNSGKNGFDFLAIELSLDRTIISVTPGSPVYLKGLGDLLERAETEKREILGQVRTGKNRPGYDSPDPWYDGRSPMHNYTIIDSPRDGTVLSRDEIRKIIKTFCSL